MAELVVCVVLAVVLSPLVFPRSVSVVEAARVGKPVIYWRPGCQFCLRLRFTLLGSAGGASWVNIWSDPAAAAAVRAVADGNETVPTVLVGSESRVNPAPRWVREQLEHR
ncbi:glutaredoxin domain-containing protein [Kribbella sp. NPDC004875]|uniref:glutaredoxin domain-containing protein n=1 Tax=Kribbella sp. NPDC004875 TaxID=3364107 RepID=UPI0036B6B67F